jgi:hypothetical protein
MDNTRRHHRADWRDLILLTTFAAGALGLGFAQTGYDIAVTPPGTVFPFTHNYAPDFYYYLQLMRQGMQGSFGATSLMTPETFPPQFINPVFVLLGHAARVTGTGLPAWYLAARIAGALGLVAGIFLFVRRVTGNRTVQALILGAVVLGTPVWHLANGRPVMPVLLSVWSQLDPMVRFSYIPHHLISKVFLVLAFAVFVRGGGRKAVVAFSLATLLMGFASPVTIAAYLITLAGYAGIGFLSTRERFFADRERLVMMAAGGAVAVLTALYHRQVQQGVFPWTSYQQWETVQYPLTFATYAEAFGPQLVLFFLSLPLLASLGPPGWLTAAWGLSGWVGIAVCRFVPLSNVRFVEGYQFIPVAAGTGIALSGLMARLKPAGARRIATALAIAGLTAYAGVGIAASWMSHLTYSASDVKNPLQYIPRSWMDMFAFLSAQPQQQLVAVPMPLSTMIPAMTGQRAIAGHQMMTFDAPQKEADLIAIFRFDKEAVRLTEKYRVGYIVTTTSSLPPESFTAETGFSPVYTRDGIVIYATRRAH